MRPERLGMVSTTARGHDLVAFEDMVVLRDTSAVVGWSPRADAFAWVHELHEDQMFGMKRLYAVGDAVITIEETAHGLPKHIVWLDSKTGHVLRKVDSPLELSQGGFAVVDDVVFIHGKEPGNRWRCLRIDGLSGRILGEDDAPGGRELVPLNGTMYLHARSRGLFHTDVQDGKWKHEEIGKVTSIAAWEQYLFFFLAPAGGEPDWSLVCWDTTRHNERGRVVMDVPQALLLAPAGEPGLVAVFLENLGLWMMDLEAGRSLWQLQPEEGWRVRAAVSTSSGLAVPTGGGGRPRAIEIRQPRTGEVRAALPLDMGNVYRLHWARDLLVVSSMRGLACFRMC